MNPTTLDLAPGAVIPAAHKNLPGNELPKAPATMIFAASGGSTSPVLSPDMRQAQLQSIVTGLDPWMIEFQRNMPKLPVDPLSNAEPDKAVTTHLVWDVKNINFQNKVVTARATYQYHNKVEGNDTLVLDVKNLEIESVFVNGKITKNFEIKSKDAPMPNDAMLIQIPAAKGSGEVVINYKTKPESSAFYWVDSQYTEGKKHPLLYTLFEPFEGGSAIPGQHTPQVRLTFEVNASTGSPELMALSSSNNNPTERSADGYYSGIRMNRAVPIYLLSLHVGNFKFHSYGDGKTGVYAEEAMLNEAADKLKELPAYMKAAEEICGPYNWGKYCPILMCWAFPYMAMEHPCASTCGAVCLEQPVVVPHELAHSWTGNDITNCNWQQFWWNEGFTTFEEYLICEKIWGTDYANLVFLYTLEEAVSAIDEWRNKNPDVLKLCSSGTTFEFTRIPYAKGALFLFMLREAIGKPDFSQFIKDYMKVFYQNTMSDDRFLAFLKLWVEKKKGISDFETFKKEHQIQVWLYGTEIPSNAPKFTSNLMQTIEQEACKVIEGKIETVDKLKIQGWDVYLQITFLNSLKGKASKEQLAALDKLMGYTGTDSMSIKGAWALLCSTAGYFTEGTNEMISSYVIKRNSLHEANKISVALCKTPEGKSLAQSILKTENGMLFPVTRQAIEKNLSGNAK